MTVEVSLPFDITTHVVAARCSCCALDEVCSLIGAGRNASRTVSSLDEESLVVSSSCVLDGEVFLLRILNAGSSLRALNAGPSLRALNAGSSTSRTLNAESRHPLHEHIMRGHPCSLLLMGDRRCLSHLELFLLPVREGLSFFCSPSSCSWSLPLGQATSQRTHGSRLASRGVPRL